MTHDAILSVDDETKIRRALRSALRDEGNEVVVAGSAREAQRRGCRRLQFAGPVSVTNVLDRRICSVPSSASTETRVSAPFA
jgi:CheY-like chemotaxis protein